MQVAEPLPSSVCSGNLSVLKKRWEQQQQSPSHRSHPPATPCNPAKPQTHISPSTDSKPASSSQIKNQPDTLKTPTLSQDHDPEAETQVPSETSFNQLQSAQPEGPDDMEMKPGRDSEGEGAAAAVVPDSEKPSVPLNSLKMMFEKGENVIDKVSLFFALIKHH